MKASLRYALAAVVLATSGCSLIDPTDSPALTFEERLCNSNADCIGLEDTITDLDGITSLPCVVISTGCNTSRNRCEVRVEQVSDADGDGVDAVACMGNDCDDTRATVFPGAREACDGVVSDCSAANGGMPRAEEDADGDEYSTPEADCIGGGLAFPKTDCDDANPNTYPDAPESCDGEINSCDALGAREVEDMDGDQHAAPNADCITIADNPNVYPKDDCDDADPTTYPGAPEVCDRRFNDCSSTEPRIVEDADGDGRASFQAPCEGGPLPKNECVGADLDPTTRYCAPTEMASILTGLTNAAAIGMLEVTAGGGPDVIVATGVGGSARTCTNSPAGSFNCAAPFAFPAGVRRFRPGNGDNTGTSDLFFASLGAGEIGFVTPTAPGAPIMGVTGLDGAQPIEFDVVSAGGDARSDVVVADVATGSIVVAINDGSGAWPRTTVTALTAPRAATGADFDGDGVLDVAATNAAGNVVVSLSNGAAFGTWTTSTLATITGDLRALESGDLDADGDADIVVGDATSGRIVAFLNADGVFTQVAVVPEAAPTARLPGVETLVVEDFDLDGDLDLLATSALVDTVAWWELAGSMIWFRHDVVSDFDNVQSLALGDVDLDGDLDVLAAAAGTGGATWWRSHFVSDVEFTPRRVDRAFDGAFDVRLGDLDGDGDLDIVGAAAVDGNVTAWINLDGAGATLAEIAIDLVFANARFITVADVDRDGDLDVIAASPTTIAWWANADGTGRTWLARQTIVTGLTVGSQIAAGDADGDGDVDVVGSNGDAGGAITLYTNDAGTFTGAAIGTINQPRGLALGDVNRDGRVDVVVAARSGSVHLLTRDAGGSYAASIVGALVNATDVALGDVDRDDDLDVVAVATGGVVVCFRNDSAGFTLLPVSATTVAASDASIVLADLDADADLDVVVSLRNAQTIRWYESTSFSASVWVTHTAYAGQVVQGIDAGDIDGDRDVDLAAALEFEDDVIWLESDGAAWWNP